MKISPITVVVEVRSSGASSLQALLSRFGDLLLSKCRKYIYIDVLGFDD